MPVVGLGLALGAWQTAGAWGPGPVNGDDTMAQLVRNEAGLQLLGHGRLDGWFPRFMLGHQLFLFFGPGFTLVLGALKLATFGLLSTAGAYKAAGMFGVALLSPAALFLSRSLGLRRPEAAAASVLVLAIDNPFGLGLAGTYVIGLVPHQVAGSFFCVGLGCLARTLDDPRRRWVVAGAASLVALALTHLISALVLVVFLPLLLGGRLLAGRVPWRGLTRAAVTGATAAGLAAFWLIPLAVHRDLQGPVTAWATPPIGERLAALARGEILWSRPFAVIAVTGMVVCAATAWRRRRWAGFLALGPAAYLAVAHLVADRLDGGVALQLANRGLGYAGLLAALAAGAAVGAGVRVGARALTSRRRPPAHRLASDDHGLARAVAAAVIAGVLVVGTTGDGRDVVGTQRAPTAAMARTAEVLARVVPSTGRFATERDFPNEIAATGTVHPDLWLAATSGRNTLNLFNPESSPSDAGFAAEQIGTESPAVTATTLGRYGVTHVVTVRPDTPQLLVVSPAFRLVARHGDLAVFAIAAEESDPAPGLITAAEASTARVTSDTRAAGAEALEVAVTATAATPVVVALSWSPKWRATVDGATVPTREGAHGVVSLDVPEGHHVVALRFRTDGWDRLGLAVSGLTAIAVWAYSVSLMSRRRSRTAKITASMRE